MRTDARNGLVMIAIIVVSVLAAGIVWVTSSRLAWAGLCGLLTGLGLITVYSWMAFLFGWPKPRWSDLWAINYLLP